MIKSELNGLSAANDEAAVPTYEDHVGLQHRIDPSDEHKFLIDTREGFRILFVTRAMERAGGGEPLWWREAGNDESLRAISRWVSLRRSRWSEWGRLAAEMGKDAFRAHMERLWVDEPLALVVGATVRIDDDPCVLGFGEATNGADGMQLCVLYRHTFATEEYRRKFYEWLHSDGNIDLLSGLIDIGYSNGLIELGRVLDRLAEEAGAKRSPRGRRRGRRSTQAA